MIVKIWPIKADYAKDKSKIGGQEGLKNAFDYIMDPEKVIVSRDEINQMNVLDTDNIEQGPEAIEDDNRRRVLNYMANEDKIEGKFISGYLCDPDQAVAEFNLSRERDLLAANRSGKKESGALAFHMVQSFPEGLSISDEEVHQCGLELCEKLKVHQAVVCSHVHPLKDEDGVVHGKCKHNHILFNAYIHPDYLDPEHPERMKYNDCKETYAQLRAWNDEIAINHGLPIIRNPDDDRTYSWTETDAISKGLSWKQQIRNDIETARRASSCWEEFVQHMEEAGYKIKVGAHESYTAPDGKHIARGKTLGRQYTKTRLERYWAYSNTFRQSAEQEAKENASPPLLDTVLDSRESLRAAIPLGMKNRNPPQYYYLPMEGISHSPEVIATYFNQNELYDICDEKNRPVAAATGLEIIKCMEQLRLSKQHLLGEKDKEEKPETETDFSKKHKREQYYTYAFFINSRTKKQYRTSLHDENGRRRSVLELMILLAITVLKNETGLWEPAAVPDGKGNDPIYAPRSWKIQNMLDAISTAQEEQIETPAQLDRRLNEVGAAYSRAKSALKKTTRVKEKMETLHESVKEYRATAAIAQQILSMPEGLDKEQAREEYIDVLDRYRTAKAVLYQYGVNTEEEIVDFEQRYKKITDDIEELTDRFEQKKEEYRKIKKLSYNIELAQNFQYCYGPEYSYDRQGAKEQSRESDEARNERAEEQKKTINREVEDDEKDLSDNGKI